MASSTSPLILYGVPFSQPVRAVMWLMLYKRLPFEMTLVIPGVSGRHGSRNSDYLSRNPGGTVPTIQEPATGFVLGEAHAILCYLCNKHGWTDLYSAEPEARARIDWYLHYHHRNVREASAGVVAPRVRSDLSFAEEAQAASRKTLTRALNVLDQGWLSRSMFLAGDSVTIADLAAYVEIGQLQPCFTNMYDLSPFPHIEAWLQRMRGLPGHDDAHVVLAELGDISREAPTLEALRNANRAALSALKARLAEFA